MRRAILGAGGVGGLVGSVLARAGHPVTLLVWPGRAEQYPERLSVQSRSLGSFEAPVRVVFVSLANDGAGAFVKEIVLRGIVFRISEEQIGTGVVLAISVVLFALLHLAGPNATVTSSLVVGIEGGCSSLWPTCSRGGRGLRSGSTSGGTSPRTPSSGSARAPEDW